MSPPSAAAAAVAAAAVAAAAASAAAAAAAAPVAAAAAAAAATPLKAGTDQGLMHPVSGHCTSAAGGSKLPWSPRLPCP